jgi:hypothetical protein
MSNYGKLGLWDVGWGNTGGDSAWETRPSLERLGYRRLSLRDRNRAKGAVIVGKNWEPYGVQ